MAILWENITWDLTYFEEFIQIVLQFEHSIVSQPKAKWKIHVFRVTTLPKLTVETLNVFQVFWGKNIILCILKGEMPFKMYKIIFFPKKKN